jgi:hypothetical protein
MSKIKTYYHDAFEKETRRSHTYRFTLPVIGGVIWDTHGRLDTLRAVVSGDNALLRRTRIVTIVPQTVTHRYVIDLKYRGPRRGARYNTPKQYATAVDVYLRLRADWAQS